MAMSTMCSSSLETGHCWQHLTKSDPVLLLQVALESVSATHQLVSAVHTLAICVRPLLLTGFALSPESAESGPVHAGEHKVTNMI